MKLIKKDKKGFTLVELIVVIAILAILALILIPAITGYVGEANKSKDQANARALYSAAVLAESTNAGDAYTDETLEDAIQKDTGIDKGKFEAKIDATSRKITITFGKWTFDGTDFSAAKEAPEVKPGA